MSVPTQTLQPEARRQVRTRRLAGWRSSGMLDWPGRVSATLFVSGCNMECPYCHNAQLCAVNTGASDDTWMQVDRFLDSRRAWIDGVVITGGEPTADPDLVPTIEHFADRGIPVKLDSNGMEPAVLELVLGRGLVDYVALDVKTEPASYARMTHVPDPAARIIRSIEIVRGSGIAHEFRTTCHPGTVALDALTHIARLLKGGQLLALQQYRPPTVTAAGTDATQYSPSQLLDAAQACSNELPTITRGV